MCSPVCALMLMARRVVSVRLIKVVSAGGRAIRRVGAVSVCLGTVVPARSLCGRSGGRGAGGPSRGSARSAGSSCVVTLRVIIGVSISRRVSAGVLRT